MTQPNATAGVEKLSAIVNDRLVRVERVDDSEYVLAHTDDMSLVYGGLVSEDGMELCQVMVGNQAARFDTDTMEMEYVEA